LKERHRSFLALLGSAVLILVFVLSVNTVNIEKSLALNQTRVFGGPLGSTIAQAEENVIFNQPQNLLSPSLSFRSNAVLGFSNPIASPLSGNQVNSVDLINKTVFSYTVQENDTLESLAARFSVDVSTIVWANNLSSVEIKPGDFLVILPVSGILHEVSANDSIDSIAADYGVSKERIVLANSLIKDEVVMSGEKLVIPGGTEKQKLSLNNSTAQTSSGFRMPTIGWNWGRLHDNTGVDIANPCGTPVYASLSGFVKDARDDGTKSLTSNGGYGSFVSIKHRSNLETLYAHLSAVFVSSGAFVNEGDLIGATGNTGRVDGYTGCHLHFGVFGAPNPFVTLQ